MRVLRAPLCLQDAFQEEYYRTGTFPETPMVPPRRPWTLLNWLFWASLLLYPFFRFLVNMVSSGSSLTLASFVLVFFVGKWLAWEAMVQAKWGQVSTRGADFIPGLVSPSPESIGPGPPLAVQLLAPLPSCGVAVSTGVEPPGQVGSDWCLQVLVHTGTGPQLGQGVPSQ